MAAKNFLDASEVPTPTGNAERDIRNICNFLCNLAGQAGYEITALKSAMQSIESAGASGESRTAKGVWG